MIQGKWFAPGSDLSQVLSVRETVFGRGKDSLDSLSWNVLVYQDNVPAATGRIWWEDGVFWLGNLCVIESFRHHHLGDLVLRLLLYKAQSHAAREVRLRCSVELTGFFSRLGLLPVQEFPPNLVEMMIQGETIELDSCKNCPKSSCPNRKDHP